MDDIRKLMFSFGASPLADNTHRGISPLSFVLMLATEENQVREDQEAYNGTTSLIPGMTRAAKRKCPSIPTTLRELVELLQRYISAGHLLFTARYDHFVEVMRIWQELMLIFRRNKGIISANNIATVLISAMMASNFFPATQCIFSPRQRPIPKSPCAHPMYLPLLVAFCAIQDLSRRVLMPNTGGHTMDTMQQYPRNMPQFINIGGLHHGAKVIHIHFKHFYKGNACGFNILLRPYFLEGS